MNRTTDFIDLCSDDEISSPTAVACRQDVAAVLGTSHIKKNEQVKKGQQRNSQNQSIRQEADKQINIDACIENGNSIVLNENVSQAVCRKFWKAGNYETAKRQRLKASHQNKGNHLHAHPLFLHSNATSHKWVFGAIAELLDNVVDEEQNGATFVGVDKISNPRDESPGLLIQDDGGGMDPQAIRRCMSFGFSDKNMKNSIGHYGNGFKASSMRLGADVLVFTRNMKMRTLTQSIGFLSYTFLRQMDYERIVVPIVDYEFNSSTGTFGPLLEHGEEHFFSNLSIMLKWSPYKTEGELLEQFDDIGPHGTKVVVFNLWLNDDGDVELDFDSDLEDIRISGHAKLFQEGDTDSEKSAYDQHIANRYNYSLRAYLSILYLRLPDSFKIILRGHVVEHHNIADDLKYIQYIMYKPQKYDNSEAIVVTTIGFLKEAPHINIHGFCIYHRNRLILPYWCVVKNRAGSPGKGIVGILEANYIEPTQNKQDFERTSLCQKLEDRLKQMTLEYWRLYYKLISCQPVSNALGSFQDLIVPRRKRSPGLRRARSKQGPTMKRNKNNAPMEIEDAEQYTRLESLATNTWYPDEVQTENSIEDQIENQELMTVRQTNKKLRSRLVDFEKNEVVLNLKVQQLRAELDDAWREYTMLFYELGSLDMIKEE